MKIICFSTNFFCYGSLTLSGKILLFSETFQRDFQDCNLRVHRNILNINYSLKFFFQSILPNRQKKFRPFVKCFQYGESNCILVVRGNIWWKISCLKMLYANSKFFSDIGELNFWLSDKNLPAGLSKLHSRCP